MAIIIRFYAAVCVLLLSPAFASARPQVASRADRAVATSVCENAQEHLISVNGGRVRYLEAGAGRTVVLIHGNAGSADDFSYRAVRVLCGEYRVVAIDRPGHGKSDRLTKDPARLESQGASLHETLKSLGIKQPILIGHSWGASLALAYALTYQDDISGMVLLAPAAYREPLQNAWWLTIVKRPVIGEVSLAVGKLLFGKRMLKKELQ